MLPLKWGGFDSALKTDLFFFLLRLKIRERKFSSLILEDKISELKSLDL